MNTAEAPAVQTTVNVEAPKPTLNGAIYTKEDYDEGVKAEREKAVAEYIAKQRAEASVAASIASQMAPTPVGLIAVDNSNGPVQLPAAPMAVTVTHNGSKNHFASIFGVILQVLELGLPVAISLVHNPKANNVLVQTNSAVGAVGQIFTPQQG